ncbi:hypothetical protein QQ045_016781 [Rhodiola kirilowii]
MDFFFHLHRTLRSDCREDNYLFFKEQHFLHASESTTNSILAYQSYTRCVRRCCWEYLAAILLNHRYNIWTSVTTGIFYLVCNFVRPSVRSQHTKEVQKANIRIESVPVDFTTKNFF